MIIKKKKTGEISFQLDDHLQFFFRKTICNLCQSATIYIYFNKINKKKEKVSQHDRTEDTCANYSI